FGRPEPLVEHPALVKRIEEAPDVLDIGVGEREVVVAPVHPVSEAFRPPGQLLDRPGHLLTALAGEVLQSVRLDVPLRVETELLFDADLDPETLTVESVLIAQVMAGGRLVSLEDVLQGAAPGGDRKSTRLNSSHVKIS